MGIFDGFEKSAANHAPLSPLSFLKRTALMFPDLDAVIYGERRYSWSQVYDRSKQLASALNTRGIGRGDTVAVLSANTPEMVEAHFGIPMSGAVLNTINTRLDADTIGYILDHGEAKAFIVDGELAPQAEAAIQGRDILIIDVADLQDNPNPNRIGSIDYADFIATGNADADWKMPSDEWDAIALNYTSGSTGRPKGVVYHHRGAYLMGSQNFAFRRCADCVGDDFECGCGRHKAVRLHGERDDCGCATACRSFGRHRKPWVQCDPSLRADRNLWAHRDVHVEQRLG